MNLVPANSRVFLFHSPSASADPGLAMNPVNEWLTKDRASSRFPNLRVVDISVTPDGAGGVYTLVVCDLGVPREAVSSGEGA